MFEELERNGDKKEKPLYLPLLSFVNYPQIFSLWVVYLFSKLYVPLFIFMFI